MTEIVLDARTLPEPLFRLIRTEKVKVRESDGEIRLTPIIDTTKGCPLRGMFTDGKISVDKFIENKQTEKEIER
jgi:hypothetical protein